MTIVTQNFGKLTPQQTLLLVWHLPDHAGDAGRCAGRHFIEDEAVKVEITDEAADQVVVKTCEAILTPGSWCYGLDDDEREDLQAAAKIMRRYFERGNDGD